MQLTNLLEVVAVKNPAIILVLTERNKAMHAIFLETKVTFYRQNCFNL